MAANNAGELWHKRLCHMSQKGMQRLAEDNLIPEVKDVHLERCTDCLADKQNRTSFRLRPPSRRKAPLELVHTNVCQVETKSHAGSQYFVTFMEDYNRKLWVSLLKTKDQILFAFKEFHARVERETGSKLKAVRVDNEGEYRGQFKEYCRLKGIRLEYTMPTTPEFNGLAERMNRTIMDRVWSMLAHAKLSKTFWVEALMTATFVINRSPSTPLDGVPQRVWTYKDVSYRHLKVFGCLAYVHVAKDKRGKLDSKTHLCIFLGYGDDEFSYWLWNLAERKGDLEP